jgi:hypothetical protein
MHHTPASSLAYCRGVSVNLFLARRASVESGNGQNFKQIKLIVMEDLTNLILALMRAAFSFLLGSAGFLPE